MENGLFQFIERFEEFKFQIQNGTETIQRSNQIRFEPITLDEFQYVSIVFIYLLIGIILIATIVQLT